MITKFVLDYNQLFVAAFLSFSNLKTQLNILINEMLNIKSLVQIVPRRLMASSVSKGPGGGKEGTSQDKWLEEERRARNELEKTKDDHHHGIDPTDDPFIGQTTVNHNHDGVGFKQFSQSKDTYFNPLLTPPPRSPQTPEDFANPSRLGHWTSDGFSYTSPVADNYYYHELTFLLVFGVIIGGAGFYYAPDVHLHDWARREAFLRIAKREALGIPLIDRNVVDPERVVLPTEEELEDYKVIM